MTMKKKPTKPTISNESVLLQELQSAQQKIDNLYQIIVLLLSKAGGSIKIEKQFLKVFLEKASNYTYELNHDKENEFLDIKLVEIKSE